MPITFGINQLCMTARRSADEHLIPRVSYRGFHISNAERGISALRDFSTGSLELNWLQEQPLARKMLQSARKGTSDAGHGGRVKR